LILILILQDLILRMAELMIMKPGLWVLGHSKLLMKHDQHGFITETMHKVQADAAVKCQKLARRYLVRKWFVKIEALRTGLMLAVRNRSKDDLLKAIEAITEHGGMDHIPDLKVMNVSARVHMGAISGINVGHDCKYSHAHSLERRLRYNAEGASDGPALFTADSSMEREYDEHEATRRICKTIRTFF
jgi:hypothetical protein